MAKKVQMIVRGLFWLAVGFAGMQLAIFAAHIAWALNAD